MDIGELLRGIMAPSVAGAPPAAAPPMQLQPPGMGPAPAPGGGATGIAAPAPAAPGAAPAPPDLGTLYTKLLDQQRSDKYMDRGATLIAAGFAQPQNRQTLISSAFGGGGGGDSAASTLQVLQKLQAEQQAKAAKLAMKARLPALAKQYGLDMDTVNFLFESGKLDETINTLAQPNVTTTKANDGSTLVLDKRGNVVKTIDGPDPLRGKELAKDASGANILVDKLNPGAAPQVISPGDPNQGLTSDQKHLKQVNEERKAQGLPAISTEKWLETADINRAAKMTVSLGDKAEQKVANDRIDELSKKAAVVDSGLVTLERLNSAREALDKGVMTGSIASEPVKEARKVLAQAFGIEDDIANNTDVFLAQMKDIVLPRVKALGTGNSISNADVKFIEAATGAGANLSPETAREILRIIEKGERNFAKRYHRDVEEFGKLDGMEKAGKLMKRFQLPPPRTTPATIEKLKAEIAKGGAAAVAAIKQFDEKFGDDSAESVLGAQ
jgi:hypothetical protein